MTAPTRTCMRCLREGTRAFTEPRYSFGGAGPVCANEDACSRRAVERGVPERAIRASGFFTAVDIHDGDTDLKLSTVLFIHGGSMLWMEGDTLVVWHCIYQGRHPFPTRYPTTRRPCDCTPAMLAASS